MPELISSMTLCVSGYIIFMIANMSPFSMLITDDILGMNSFLYEIFESVRIFYSQTDRIDVIDSSGNSELARLLLTIKNISEF